MIKQISRSNYTFMSIIVLFLLSQSKMASAQTDNKILETKVDSSAQSEGIIKPLSIDLLKLFVDKDEDALILINALSPEAYKDCHIKAQGSINFPSDLEEEEAQKWEKNLLKKYPKAKEEPIVVYCASYTCGASEKASKRLQKMGFKKIFEYKGGTREWFEKYGKESCEGECTMEYLFQ